MTALAAGISEPTTVIGLAGLLIVTVGGWVKSWIEGKRHGDDIRKIRDQVQNGHAETNLRDDLDSLKSMLTEQTKDIRGLRQDIGGLRGELREERQARSELERAVERINRRSGA